MSKSEFGLRESKTVLLKDGRILGYAEYGEPQGRPLLYFHGWPSSRLQARSTDTAAKKLGIRVISPDRPGYGLSTFKENSTLLDWAEDVSELLDRLEIKKCSVIGVSGGGPYAAVCAYAMPERLMTVGIVVGLAPPYIPGLLEGMAPLSKFCWEHYGHSPLLRFVSAFSNFLNARYGPSLGLHRFLFGAKQDKQIYADNHVREMIRRNYREAFRSGYSGVEHDLKLYTQDWGFDLKQITSKVQLYYGDEDMNTPIQMGEYFLSHIPNSTLKIYPGEGHLISRTHCEEMIASLMT